MTNVINLGWLSLLPPLIAIVLALWTKEVILSLLAGVITGCVIYTGGSPIGTIETLFEVMTCKMQDNIYILFFLGLLGILIVNINKSGGAMAYGEWVSKYIKNRVGAQIATVLLSLMFFIDDYFNCLTVGTVMIPLTDRHKISRAKLAYLIDSTAAPICIIVPISSWAAFVIASLEDYGVENPFIAFVRTIPYNFYALLTIVMVWGLTMSRVDFGLMARLEKKAIDKSVFNDPVNNIETEVLADENSKKKSPANKGKGIDLVLPICALIVFSILFLRNKGIDSSKDLTYGAAIAVIVAFITSVFGKRMAFKEFISGISDGISSMVPSYLILILAWSIAGVCDRVGTDAYVKQLVEAANVPLWILPCIIFIISGLLAFSTGTAWGTFGILIPVVLGICEGAPEKIMILSVSAILAGATYGNHSSPISDTNIMSSAGAGCDHIEHVASQLPYVTIVAGVSCICYLIAGLTRSVYIPISMGIIITLATIFLQHKFNKTAVRL